MNSRRGMRIVMSPSPWGSKPREDNVSGALKLFKIAHNELHATICEGTLIELVKARIPKRFDLDPIRDVQVLCPVNLAPGRS